MNKDLLQSRTIDMLRFPLSIGVVFIHSFGWGGYSACNQQDTHYAYEIIRVLCSKILPHFAVPLFFLISGYLFFCKVNDWNKDVFVEKIKTRARTLIIPYFCWNIIKLLFDLLIKAKNGELDVFYTELSEKGVCNLFYAWHTWGEHMNIIGQQLSSTGPVSLPLWFLRDLIIVSLLTPVIFWYIKRFKIYSIILLSVIYILNFRTMIPGFSTTAIFFFSIGAYWGINKKNIVSELEPYKIYMYLAALLTLIYCVYSIVNGAYQHDLYAYRLYVISATLTAICIVAFIVDKYNLTPNKFLAKSSFFIYVSHGITLWLSGHIVSRLIVGETQLMLILGYFTRPILAISMCIIAYYIMSKYFPRMLKFTTGGR